jgi:hypothetical protein
MEGSGCGLMQGTILAFVWAKERHIKTSVTIASLWVEILSQDIPNTKQEC